MIPNSILSQRTCLFLNNISNRFKRWHQKKSTRFSLRSNLSRWSRTNRSPKKYNLRFWYTLNNSQIIIEVLSIECNLFWCWVSLVNSVARVFHRKNMNLSIKIRNLKRCLPSFSPWHRTRDRLLNRCLLHYRGNRSLVWSYH